MFISFINYLFVWVFLKINFTVICKSENAWKKAVSWQRPKFYYTYIHGIMCAKTVLMSWCVWYYTYAAMQAIQTLFFMWLILLHIGAGKMSENWSSMQVSSSATTSERDPASERTPESYNQEPPFANDRTSTRCSCSPATWLLSTGKCSVNGQVNCCWETSRLCIPRHKHRIENLIISFVFIKDAFWN